VSICVHPCPTTKWAGVAKIIYSIRVLLAKPVLYILRVIRSIHGFPSIRVVSRILVHRTIREIRGNKKEQSGCFRIRLLSVNRGVQKKLHHYLFLLNN
jgi:hypothetical protein